MWMSGWLFIVSMLRCAGQDVGMQECRGNETCEAGGAGWAIARRLVWIARGNLVWTEWQNQSISVDPHEPDSRAHSGARGGGEQGDRVMEGSGGLASLPKWRRQRKLVEQNDRENRGAWGAGGAGGARGRRRPCVGGEYTDGSWVAKAAGEMENGRPCCYDFELENQTDDSCRLKTCVTCHGYQCKGWADQYAWQPAR